MFGLLGGALLILFFKSLDPHQILFANDFPLGALKADCNRLPERFTGTWRELAWLGGEAPAASPNITMLMQTLVSPVIYLKIYAPFTLLFLGFSAWLFFRQLNFNPVVCVLGGVAAGLNGHFFSIACWGLGFWNISAGCAFLTMAALCARSIPKFWERAVLAGLAVGMGVMEGFDVGAILSIYAGIFIIFRALNDEAPIGKRVFNAVIAETLVVLFAAIIAYNTMSTLVRTQVEGVASMGQDAQTKQARWNAATQWSLPKVETLSIVVPGLFGYRLSGNIDQKDHTGAYWGRVGQDPRLEPLGSANPTVRSNALIAISDPSQAGADIDDPVARANAVTAAWQLTDSFLDKLNTSDRYSRTTGMQAVTKKTGIYWRYCGSGECAGMMVSLLAIFAVANFFGKDRPLSKLERTAVGYWGVVALFSLLASWGRFGYVYQFLYKIPEVSTIRNPIKFMHPFHIAWIVLAAYGMEILYRRYLRGPDRSVGDFLPNEIQAWWKKVSGFDRKWTIFMMVLVGVTGLAAAILFADKTGLVRYLEEQNFASPMPQQMATFCLERAGAFLVFLIAGAGVMAAIFSGAWAGSRSKWAWFWLGALIIGDLARADIPWIHYYDYKEKYTLNPITDFLLDKPWDHRVIGKLEPRGPGSGIQQGFGQLYFFWLQNDFPYHNLQTLDFSQAPHLPDMDRLYLKAFELSGNDPKTTDLRPAVRLWQLTNTRYILGYVAGMERLNNDADPAHRSFKVDGRYNMRVKPGLAAATDIGDYTVEPDQRGAYGIIESTRTLPRAKLYSNWQTPTNDEEALHILGHQAFDPWQTVLISVETPLAQPSSTATADAGTVTITDYHPKRVRLEADASTASILLLNDRYNTDWRVFVDNAPAPLLRCNYIMRGVSLTPGHHVVEFRFQPSLQSLYVSLSAIIIGIILAGYLIVTRKVSTAPSGVQPPTGPAPPSTPATAPAPSLSKPGAPTASGAQQKNQKNTGKPKRPK